MSIDKYEELSLLAGELVNLLHIYGMAPNTEGLKNQILELLGTIEKLARSIGGVVSSEAKNVNEEARRFLENPHADLPRELTEKVLRLKNEVREL